jgi:hypothetical protein
LALRPLKWLFGRLIGSSTFKLALRPLKWLFGRYVYVCVLVLVWVVVWVWVLVWVWLGGLRFFNKRERELFFVVDAVEIVDGMAG